MKILLSVIRYILNVKKKILILIRFLYKNIVSFVRTVVRRLLCRSLASSYIFAIDQSSRIIRNFPSYRRSILIISVLCSFSNHSQGRIVFFFFNNETSVCDTTGNKVLSDVITSTITEQRDVFSSFFFGGCRLFSCFFFLLHIRM